MKTGKLQSRLSRIGLQVTMLNLLPMETDMTITLSSCMEYVSAHSFQTKSTSKREKELKMLYTYIYTSV